MPVKKTKAFQLSEFLRIWSSHDSNLFGYIWGYTVNHILHGRKIP